MEPVDGQFFEMGDQWWPLSVLALAPISTPSTISRRCACGIPTTPGMMREVTRAMICTSPRSLNTRRVSPFWMPRDSASMGLIHRQWRQACWSSSITW